MKSKLSFAFALAGLLGTTFVFAGAGTKTFAPADARGTFNTRCASCHGRDGRGKTPRGRRTHSRDLTEPGWQNDVSDERLFNSISNGRGRMPAFRKSISENDIDALVGYVRQLKR